MNSKKKNKQKKYCNYFINISAVVNLNWGFQHRAENNDVNFKYNFSR